MRKLLYVESKIGEKQKVIGKHYFPLDVEKGVPQHIIDANILVDTILDEPLLKEGKESIHYINPQTNEQWFEYVDRPLTPEEELRLLKELLKTADQKYKDLDLSVATLEEVKAAKMEQLNELCNAAIVNGFEYTVNEVSYHFSCSLSAQANFQGTDTLFKDGVITEAEWTVINNATGMEERIILDQTTFNAIKLAVFGHINANITRFRNVLQPLVESAITNQEVDAVMW